MDWEWKGIWIKLFGKVIGICGGSGQEMEWFFFDKSRGNNFWWNELEIERNLNGKILVIKSIIWLLKWECKGQK